MLPKYNDQLANDFEIVKMPGKTYYYNIEKQTISGFIDDITALKQAIYLILISKRYEHELYSSSYGLETDELVGCPDGVVYPRIERIFTDALLQDDRITSISDFDFKRERDTLRVSFKVSSNIGNFKVEKSMTY